IQLKMTGGLALQGLDARQLELQQALRDLEGSRSVLQSVVDTAPMRVFWKDRSLRYLGCNPLFARDAGVANPAELVGQDDHALVWRANAEAYRLDDEAVMTTGQPKLAYEEPQTTPDGSTIWLRTSKVPLRDGAGSVIGVLGVYDDITDIKRNQAELTSYRDHLEELVDARTRELAVARDHAEAGSRAKSTFLANMSHELRTPMNAIMGMTGLALRRAEDPRLRNQLEKIDTASRHLLHVINDILDLSRIEADRLVLEDAELRLKDVMQGACDLVATRAREKGLRLVQDLDPDLAKRTLRGDPLRLGQILLNLVSNAVKFTESGGHVTLRAHRVREREGRILVRIEVEDTGIGVRPEDQARLFHPFEQADGSTTRRYGGTGLGLAICKRLVELMGGEIGVRSTPGAGSTFWCELALRASVRDRATPSGAPGIAAFERVRERHAGARILLAEDDPVNQEVGRALLEDAALLVDTAGDGQQAVAMAQVQDYDLILMDVQMPILNGMQATQAIRRGARNASVPVLAVTANAFGEDRDMCLAAGMDDHVSKPIRPEVLYAALLRWLDGRGTPSA
ncbi:MAG: ATP-binding protein, partial [Rhodoferax sp.]